MNVKGKYPLNNRLFHCSEFVTRGGIACDVGTDHAYLATYLVGMGISKSAVACDIAEGPLEAARATVERCGLQDSVKLVLSDGLDKVVADGITDVIIAGMGGELISKIVLRADWLRNEVNLVLQPQSKADDLRRDLYKNGFGILKEKACTDGDFVYTIMNVKFTSDYKELDEIDALVGKLDLNDADAKAYVKVIVNRFKTSAKGIRMSKSDKAIEQANKLDLLADKLLELIGEGEI